MTSQKLKFLAENRETNEQLLIKLPGDTLSDQLDRRTKLDEADPPVPLLEMLGVTLSGWPILNTAPVSETEMKYDVAFRQERSI